MKRRRRSAVSRTVRRIAEFASSNRRVFVSVSSAGLLVLVLVLGTTRFPALFRAHRYDDFVVDEAAARDLFADRTVTYLDAEATAIRKEALLKLVPPVYVMVPEIAGRQLELFSRFSSILLTSLHQEKETEARFLELQAALPDVVPRSVVDELPAGDMLSLVLDESRSRLEAVYAAGVVDPLPADLPTRNVSLFTSDQDGERMVIPATVESLFEVGRESSYLRILPESSLVPELQRAVRAVVEAFLTPNAFYDTAATAAARAEAIRDLDPVVVRIVRGERIVQQGQIVSDADFRKIRILAGSSITRNGSKIVGTIMLILGAFLVAVVLFSGEKHRELPQERDVHLIAGAVTLYALAIFISLRFVDLPSFLIPSVVLPSALGAMIVTILYRPRAALHLSILQGLLVLIASDFDSYSALFAFVSGVAGMVSVRGARKRLDLIRASLTLALIQGFAMATLGIFRVETPAHVAAMAGWGSLSGVITGILNLGLLPFLEHATNAATPFRLIELSDLNAPILKKMLTLAPGTYGHTVMVANLAESACSEIGADSLLARVGAYYHDIGKIEQAGYFVENQTGDNKHDDLKPSLSVAVIKSHVKIGIEKAKELGLPKAVVDIIAQHHGSQLIHYFYAQAVKSDSVDHVRRTDFSYGGTPPVSKEAAVVMLADAVEAASRTLKKPSVLKLEKFVWKLLMDKFVSEQMSNCDLTFRDLDMIKKSFVHILAGQFHSRIEYPEMDEENGRSAGTVREKAIS
jgi:cyclic-di-AMP phosphodiesterase PgpH